MPLWREHRGEAVVLVVTAVAIVAVNMFEGVLIGLRWPSSRRPGRPRTSTWTSSTRRPVARCSRTITGNATFLRLPKILDNLEALPQDRPVELDLSGLRHLDHACRTALENWAEQRGTTIGSLAKV